MGSRLCGSHLDVAVQIVRIHEISGGSLRHEFVHQLQSLSDGDVSKYGDTRDIATWSVEACYKAVPDRIAVSCEYDRNRLGCRLSCLRRRFTPGARIRATCRPSQPGALLGKLSYLPCPPPCSSDPVSTST